MKDMANGFGEYFHVNGSKYKGQFKDDCHHGQGEEDFIDGSKYIGAYLNGMKHGSGIYKWPNQNIYQGNWYCNKI